MRPDKTGYLQELRTNRACTAGKLYDDSPCVRPAIIYVRPVRRIGNEIRSGPVRSAVSDRSRTDLGPDRFDDFFRRRENFDEKQVRNGASDFVQESSTSELSSRFLSRLKVENSLATFGRIQPIVPRFIALYPL